MGLFELWSTNPAPVNNVISKWSFEYQVRNRLYCIDGGLKDIFLESEIHDKLLLTGVRSWSQVSENCSLYEMTLYEYFMSIELNFKC